MSALVLSASIVATAAIAGLVVLQTVRWVLPFADRWLALQEKLADRQHAALAKIEGPPPELLALAERESEDWAKDDVRKRIWELGKASNYDWKRVAMAMGHEYT